MSLKDSMKRAEQRKIDDEAQKKKDQEDITLLMEVTLKDAIAQSKSEYQAEGWVFEEKLIKHSPSLPGEWEIKISNKGTDFANNTKLIDGKLTIRPFRDEKNGQKWGDEFGISYYGSCWPYPKSRVLNDLSDLIFGALNGERV